MTICPRWLALVASYMAGEKSDAASETQAATTEALNAGEAQKAAEVAVADASDAANRNELREWSKPGD